RPPVLHWPSPSTVHRPTRAAIPATAPPWSRPRRGGRYVGKTGACSSFSPVSGGRRCFERSLEHCWILVPAGLIRRLQRTQHVFIRGQKDGHFRQWIADRDRLDVSDDLHTGRVRCQGERLVRRQREGFVRKAVPDHF